RCVIVDQSASDTVAGCACLAGFTAAVHVDLDIESFEITSQRQRLLSDHDGGFAAEVLLNVFAIHSDLAGALLQEYTSHAGLATAGTIVPITNHSSLLRFPEP